ncbi:hypothetical protein HNR74_005279 [Flammeovirga kamogawensis]|nr:hypothetical protein [Flammeovirga kamogawensis]
MLEQELTKQKKDKVQLKNNWQVTKTSSTITWN